MNKRVYSEEEFMQCEYCDTECNYVIVVRSGTSIALYHLWRCPYCETNWVIEEGDELFEHIPKSIKLNPNWMLAFTKWTKEE